jgi:peptidoglycan/xylan/chitin deacetylase (PgdA/CDA1 family)
MRIVSPLLKRGVYPVLAGAGVFRRAAGKGLAVVTYHGIRPAGYEPVDPALDGNLITADVFRRQLRLLKARYTVISPEEMRSWCEKGGEFPPRSVLLTCDDGLLNNLTEMLPILEEEKLRCLFFVTGASAGEERGTLWYEELFLIFLRAPAGYFAISCEGVEVAGELGARAQRLTVWWDSVKRLSRLDAEGRRTFLQLARSHFGLSHAAKSGRVDDPGSCRFSLLTRTEIRRLAGAGMTIGAHTISHPMLSKAPPELAWTEIAEIRTRLEAILGAEVWALAYPFGSPESVTPEVVAMAKKAGYHAAFLNFGGGLGVELPPYAIPRIHVTTDMNLGEFEAHLSGFYASLQRRAARSPQNRLLMAGD